MAEPNPEDPLVAEIVIMYMYSAHITVSSMYPAADLGEAPPPPSLFKQEKVHLYPHPLFVQVQAIFTLAPTLIWPHSS